MFVSWQRVIKSGWIGFKHQSGLNIATIFIMILTISLMTSLFLLQKTSQVLVQTLQEKMNMYVYFKDDLSAEDVLMIQQELTRLPEVKKIEYISKDEALTKFTKNHQDDSAIMESLEELGTNPLLASLSVQAWQANQYAVIASFLNNVSFKEIISKVDYQQKKPVIEKLFYITSTINKTGIIFAIVLSAMAVLIVFNTARLNIARSQEEIETMRLVGAANWFIRGPFLVQGILAGFFASVTTLLIFSIGLFFLSPTLKLILSGFNIFNYYLDNLLTIILIQLATGLGLGILSSWLAVRKYLKI